MKQMETDYMTFRLLTPQVQLMNWILPPVVFFNINIVWHDFFCLFVPPPDIESKNGRLDAVFKTNNKEERCCVGYTAWLCKYIVNYLNVFSCSLLFCFVFPPVSVFNRRLPKSETFAPLCLKGMHVLVKHRSFKTRYRYMNLRRRDLFNRCDVGPRSSWRCITVVLIPGGYFISTVWIHV